MEKTHDEISIHDFIVRFVADFPSYSKHEVEGWYLNAVRNAAFSDGYMPKHAMAKVTDFGENLVLEPKHAISEMHFHKSQVALAATVAKISTPVGENDSDLRSIPYLISQITTSDDK